MAGPVAVSPACYLSNSALEASFGAAAGAAAAFAAPIHRLGRRGAAAGFGQRREAAAREFLRPINRSPLDVGFL